MPGFYKRRQIIDESQSISIEGTYETDERGLVIRWDAGMQALFGIPPDQVLGQPAWDVRFATYVESRRTPAEYEKLKQECLEILKTGTGVLAGRPLQRILARADGWERRVEFLVSSIKTAKGYRILGTCRTVAGSSSQEHPAQSAYQALIEHSLQGVVIFQGQHLVFANAAAAAITGYAQRELLSFRTEELFDLLHPDSRKPARRTLQELLNGRMEPVFLEYRYRHPDGSLRWLEIHTTPTTHQGSPALQAAFLDRTARKATQDALRRSLEQERRTHELLLSLSHAAQAVLRARTASDIYRVIGEQITKLGFHAVVLTLDLEGSHAELEFATYSQEMVREAKEAIGVPMMGHRFAIQPGGYQHRAIAERRAIYGADSTPFIVEAFDSSVQARVPALAKVLNIQERIGAPLIIQGEVRGILVVNGTGLREEDLPAVEAFANQAAIALENAALTEKEQQQQEALRALSARLVRIQEAERARIARALHDETGQTLTAINLHLAQVVADLAQPSTGKHARALDHLAKTQSLVEQTTRQIREICLRLRPGILDEMGLVPALRWLTNWFAGHYELQVRFLAHGADGRLPAEVETTLYRIVQEGLTNTVRYAQAQNVSVRLDRSPIAVTLTVEDDGFGFDAEAFFSATFKESTGLMGMRERVNLVGGTIEIHSRPSHGTRLSVAIPLV